MLPLGLCRCYIKTARKHVQHQKKGFEDDSSARLSDLLGSGSLIIRSTRPPPRIWC